MTNITGWRKFATYAAIDILLVVAAGSAAVAAPITHAPAAMSPAMPTLLLLGVGLCGLPRRWRTGD